MNSLNCTIHLNKSSYYCRLALLIYVAALLLLYVSAVIVIVKMMVAAALGWQLIRIIHNPIPHPHYAVLSYQQSNWILIDNDGGQFVFSRARIVIDPGFFLLLELSGESERKFIVIFLDQLEQSTYSLLNIIIRVRDCEKKLC